jgi:hypothetical protein
MGMNKYRLKKEIKRKGEEMDEGHKQIRRRREYEDEDKKTKKVTVYVISTSVSFRTPHKKGNYSL